MGVMDRFLNYMKLNDDDDEYYDDDYYEEEEEPVVKKSSKKVTRMDYDDEEERAPRKAASQKVTQIRQQPSKRGSGNGMEVCMIKPTSVEDEREITETLLANRTVVLNMEGLDVEIAQRIIDFASGSCFAVNGKLQKISQYIFIITPASVDISGDFPELVSGSFDVPDFRK